jgi:hypothetical protein
MALAQDKLEMTVGRLYLAVVELTAQGEEMAGIIKQLAEEQGGRINLAGDLMKAEPEATPSE